MEKEYTLIDKVFLICHLCVQIKKRKKEAIKISGVVMSVKILGTGSFLPEKDVYKRQAIACWFLKQQGYDVLEQNFYTKVGEIDIIAKEDQTLVFVEVKYRKDDKKGYPAQAVDQRKQQKIRKSAMIYLKKNHLSFEQPIRFDVVEILGKKIRVIKHAF